VAGNDRGAALFSGDGELVKAWEHDSGAFFTVNMAWSPDGKTIATWESEQVQFLDGRTGEPSRPALVTPARVDVVAFHPAGRLLATGHWDARLRVWDLETGNVVFEREIVDDFPFPGDDPPCVNVARFSPDGRRLAFVGGDMNDRFVVDVGTWRPVYSGSEDGGRMGEPTDVAWSPDGERLWCAFVSGPMPVWQIDLSGPTSEVELMDGRPPRVSAGGLAVVAGCVTCLDASTGKLLWHRPDLGLALELIQAPSGYFTSTLYLESLEGLVVYTDADHPPRPLIELVEELYDPKRVRAAQAGVALFPPEL
jgi:WD40 repeat protein